MKELAHQNVVRCVDTGISSEGAPFSDRIYSERLS